MQQNISEQCKNSVVHDLPNLQQARIMAGRYTESRGIFPPYRAEADAAAVIHM